MMDPSVAGRPFSSLSGCLYAAHGVYMIIAGLFLAVFAWLIPSVLVKIIESDVVDKSDVPEVARRVLDNRDMLPLIALPVIFFGLLLVNKVPLRWVWVVLGLLSMLLPAVLLIYTFVVSIGLLYRVPEL